jgi:type II secretory pathway component PulF
LILFATPLFSLASLKIPLFGDIVMKSELARFSYMASLLIRSGVPFVQTVNLSANIFKQDEQVHELL